MSTRMTSYVLITAWALVVLQACQFFYPHEYVSLEGFPDVQVTKFREVEDGWIGLGVDAPVEYSMAREDYELLISVDEGAQRPSAVVRVRSDRPGIALRPERRHPGACFAEATYWPTDSPRVSGHLEFEGACELGEQDRLSMTFVVVDAGGDVARESVPFSFKGGALQTYMDGI